MNSLNWPAPNVWSSIAQLVRALQRSKYQIQSQARNQGRGGGGARGAFAPSLQAPKVRILILKIQVKECSRLN